MKRNMVTIIALLLTSVLYAQAPNGDLKGKFAISFYGGANIPVSGNISSSVKTTDFVYAGPHLGMGISYFFTKAIGVEAVGSYDLNFYNDKYKPQGKQPAIVTSSFSLNGIYNFGRISKTVSISPYVTAGVGTYYWKHYDDAPWREGEVAIINGAEQKGSSFGFNVGLGADYSVYKNFTVGAVLDYKMYFPKNEDEFAKDFGAQGSFTPKIKLAYILSTN